jgi:hypothetical protein
MNIIFFLYLFIIIVLIYHFFLLILLWKSSYTINFNIFRYFFVNFCLEILIRDKKILELNNYNVSFIVNLMNIGSLGDKFFFIFIVM